MNRLILIISKQFTSGLGDDLSTLKKVLGDDYEIVTDPNKRYKSVYAKIFLEHIQQAYLPIKSTYTFFIPNQEMLYTIDFSLMKYTTVLCKTDYIYNYLEADSKLKCGFTTFVDTVEAKKDYSLAVHFGGTSFMKNTVDLLKMWVDNDCFLRINKNIKLVFTCKQKIDGALKYWTSLKPVNDTIYETKCSRYKNMYLIEWMNDETYEYISGIAGFCIQPSLTEGFGNVINKSKAYKSVTITTNFPPMNELIQDPRCLIDAVPFPSFDIFKSFSNRSKYYKGPFQGARIKDFSEKLTTLFRLPVEELERIGNVQFDSYNTNHAAVERRILDILNDPPPSPLYTHDNGEMSILDAHREFKTLRVNVPDIKRRILVMSNTDKIIKAAKEIKGFDMKFITSAPDRYDPYFIIITDFKLSHNLPCSYLLYYGTSDVYHIKNPLTDLDSFCNNLHIYGHGLKEVKDATVYNVGEHHFTNIPPTIDTKNFNQSFDIWVSDRDTLVKASAIGKIPYEKIESACMTMYIPDESTVIDVGANVGTVSLVLARSNKSNVNVISFEPMPTTHSLLHRNIIQNSSYNIVSMMKTVGDIPRKDIPLSDEVFEKNYLDRSDKGKILKVSDPDRVHFGNVHIGTGNIMTNMVSIDDLHINNVSLIKIDIEGFEPPAFYGARNTIRMYMPVIVFEMNTNTITQDMMEASGIDSKVAHFSIIDECRTLGYNKMYYIPQDNYMLVPPGRRPLFEDSITRFSPVRRLKLDPRITRGYSLFTHSKPKW